MASLESLPQELILAVLTALPDVKTLGAAAITCRQLHRAFRADEGPISKQVLMNEIGPALISDAIAVLQSRPSKSSWTLPQATEFLNQYTRPGYSFNLPKWDFASVLSLSKFHSLVHHFTIDFASKALREKCNEGIGHAHVSTSPPRLSPSEIMRIERTFYRFETYCNIFGDPNVMHHSLQSLHPVDEEQNQLLFNELAPWEIEQLACIHMYLVDTLIEVFDDIIDYIPAWLKFAIDFGRPFDDWFIQYQLSRGLAWIHSVVFAKLNERRNESFLSGQRKFSSCHQNFLQDGLWHASSFEWAGFQWGEPQPEGNIGGPLTPDPDSGPERVWAWSHGGKEADFDQSYSYDELKAEGYVMWDHARLEKMRLFDKPWEGCSSEQFVVRRREDGDRRWKRMNERGSELERQGVIDFCPLE